MLLVIPAIQHLMRGQATRDALHDLETELASISLRLERAKDSGRYPPYFNLPAHEWRQHKEALSARSLSRLRTRVGNVYVKTDDLVHLVSERSYEGDAVEVSPEDDIDEVLAQVLGALEDIRRKLNRWI